LSPITGGSYTVPRIFGETREVFPLNTMPFRPNPPRATAVSDQEIDLTWGDRSGNEQGFRIWVLENRNHWWPPFDVPANMTSYRLTGLRPDTDYHIDVHAFNAAGETQNDPILERAFARTLPANSGSATLTFTSAPGLNPMCPAQPTSVVAYYDQDADLVVKNEVDGGGATVGPWPAYVEEGLTLDRGYAVRHGSRFSVNRTTQGNLVVAAMFNCDGQNPQFVAAHYAIWGNPAQHEDIRIAAGDLEDMTGNHRERKGVVMEHEGFDGNLNVDLASSRVSGRAQALVEYVTPAGLAYQVNVDFEFDAPIESK